MEPFDWMIEDLQSKNGTRVGGVRIRQTTPVFPGQSVQVDNVELLLRRTPRDSADSDLVPQIAVLRRYLPPESRGQRRYRVKRIIARCDPRIILEAEDIATRRTVAMKVLCDIRVPGEIGRFIEEAQVTAQLDHPNIPPIYELNVNELDKPFFTMKLVRGMSLKRVLDDMGDGSAELIGKYPLAELLRIFSKVCDAVGFAHAKRVVHRDLKPDNIMLGKHGEVLLMDWGLAKPLEKAAENPLHASDGRTQIRSIREDHSDAMTGTGMVVGTPGFMAPEQAAGFSRRVDQRADIYSLGAILYCMLTLEAPFDGIVADILKKVETGRFISPTERLNGQHLPHLPEGGIPPGLNATTLKAMSLLPENRHASAAELLAEINATLMLR